MSKHQSRNSLVLQLSGEGNSTSAVSPPVKHGPPDSVDPATCPLSSSMKFGIALLHAVGSLCVWILPCYGKRESQDVNSPTQRWMTETCSEDPLTNSHHPTHYPFVPPEDLLELEISPIDASFLPEFLSSASPLQVPMARSPISVSSVLEISNHATIPPSPCSSSNNSLIPDSVANAEAADSEADFEEEVEESITQTEGTNRGTMSSAVTQGQESFMSIITLPSFLQNDGFISSTLNTPSAMSQTARSSRRSTMYRGNRSSEAVPPVPSIQAPFMHGAASTPVTPASPSATIHRFPPNAPRNKNARVSLPAVFRRSGANFTTPRMRRSGTDMITVSRDTRIHFGKRASTYPATSPGMDNSSEGESQQGTDTPLPTYSLTRALVIPLPPSPTKHVNTEIDPVSINIPPTPASSTHSLDSYIHPIPPSLVHGQSDDGEPILPMYEETESTFSHVTYPNAQSDTALHRSYAAYAPHYPQMSSKLYSFSHNLSTQSFVQVPAYQANLQLPLYQRGREVSIGSPVSGRAPLPVPPLRREMSLTYGATQPPVYHHRIPRRPLPSPPVSIIGPSQDTLTPRTQSVYTENVSWRASRVGQGAPRALPAVPNVISESNQEG